jgi:hypothetical protein
MLIGYLVHLTLDEIYSVDVMDRRVKSSFGTALKLADRQHPMHTLVMAGATLLAVFAAPPTTTFVDGISSRSLWAGLHRKLLPEDKWFGIVGPLRHAGAAMPEVAAPVAPTGDIVTGSIPAAVPPSPAPTPGQ